MKLTFEPTRLAGFAILAVASATALSVGACSSSHDAKSSEASSGNGQDSVTGLIASVSGSSVQVTEPTGTAKVEVGSSAKIDEYSKAQLSDIAAGNCVRVVSKPVSAPGGPVTAASVALRPQGDDGKCWQPKNAAAGSPGPAKPRTVIGTVASVAGNTVNVAVTDANGNASQTEVTVTDTTQYTKDAPATSEAIAQGKCITAGGTKDGSGTLQATVVTLGPANNGHCPQPAGKK